MFATVAVALNSGVYLRSIFRNTRRLHGTVVNRNIGAQGDRLYLECDNGYRWRLC